MGSSYCCICRCMLHLQLQEYLLMQLSRLLMLILGSGGTGWILRHPQAQQQLQLESLLLLRAKMCEELGRCCFPWRRIVAAATFLGNGVQPHCFPWGCSHSCS